MAYSALRGASAAPCMSGIRNKHIQRIKTPAAGFSFSFICFSQARWLKFRIQALGRLMREGCWEFKVTL